MSAPRLARTLAVLLALVLTAGCDAARHAGEGAAKARDCAGLVGELTGVSWDDVSRSQAEANRAIRRLDERLRDVDSADVKQAGEALVTRLRRLRDAVADADPAAQRRAIAQVEDAAARLARTCGVSTDQVGG